MFELPRNMTIAFDPYTFPYSSLWVMDGKEMSSAASTVENGKVLPGSILQQLRIYDAQTRVE